MNINKEELQDLLKGDKVLLVDFYADWCGPCKAITPIIEELYDQYSERANIRKVNVDQNKELAQEYNIRSIPTILMFKDGEVVDKNIGQVSKTQLEEMLENHIQ